MSLLNAMGSRIDFQRLREIVVAHREVAIARVYCGEIAKEKHFAFFEYLRGLGFEVIVVKNPRSKASSSGDDPELMRAIGCQIAWDICDILSRGWYSSMILVTGGFEMADIVTKIRERGIEVEVCFPEKSCSPTLRGRATLFRPLETGCCSSKHREKLKIEQRP